MIDEKKVKERIKELELKIIEAAQTNVSRQGGIIELKKLLEKEK